MADVTVAAIEDMETIYDGLARRARAELGGPLPIPEDDVRH